jgi:hypothetical protein
MKTKWTSGDVDRIFRDTSFTRGAVQGALDDADCEEYLQRTLDLLKDLLVHGPAIVDWEERKETERAILNAAALAASSDRVARRNRTVDMFRRYMNGS